MKNQPVREILRSAPPTIEGKFSFDPSPNLPKIMTRSPSPYEGDVLSVSCLVPSGDVITFSIQFFPGNSPVHCLTVSILFRLFRSVVGFVRHWVPQVPTISYPQWLIL